MVLYVARHASLNGHSDSRPCYHCYQKIKEFGIKKIVYTTRDGNIEACKTADYYGGDISRVRSYFGCN